MEPNFNPSPPTTIELNFNPSPPTIMEPSNINDSTQFKTPDKMNPFF
jgi:hypothetical protein